MEPISQSNFLNGYNLLLIGLCALLLNSYGISPLEGCEVCGKLSHIELSEVESIDIDAESLGELSEVFVEFQKMIENPDLQSRDFFLKRWCKRAKRWFVKRVYHLFKEVMHLKDHKSPHSKNYGAYAVAKFQRDINKYCDTGDIKKHISEAKKNWEHEPNINRVLEPFFKRIKHYAKSKKDKAKHPDHDRYDFMVQRKYNPNKDYLENTPVKCAFGTVVIICGGLIMWIPVPGAVVVGEAILSCGVSMVTVGYCEEYFEEKPRGIYASDKRGLPACSSRVPRSRAAVPA